MNDRTLRTFAWNDEKNRCTMNELDREEMEILAAFEAGALRRSLDADDLLKRHREYAAAMLRKEACINEHHPLSHLWQQSNPTGVP